MAAPTFVGETETSWTNTDNITTGSISVTSGNILVVCFVIEGYQATISNDDTYAITDSGSNTWTSRQQVRVTDYCVVEVWTATAAATASITVTITQTTVGGLRDTLTKGLNVLQYSASDGVGASSKTNVASGAPTLNITTTQANSAVVVVNADWNATDGASRTWRANAGTLTEQSYFRDAARMTLYVGYHADAGAAATYAVGLSAPTGQKYAIVAVEVKGTAAAGSLPKRPLIVRQAVNRASTY